LQICQRDKIDIFFLLIRRRHVCHPAAASMSLTPQPAALPCRRRLPLPDATFPCRALGFLGNPERSTSTSALTTAEHLDGGEGEMVGRGRGAEAPSRARRWRRGSPRWARARTAVRPRAPAPPAVPTSAGTCPRGRRAPCWRARRMRSRERLMSATVASARAEVSRSTASAAATSSAARARAPREGAACTARAAAPRYPAWPPGARAAPPQPRRPSDGMNHDGGHAQPPSLLASPAALRDPANFPTEGPFRSVAVVLVQSHAWRRRRAGRQLLWTERKRS
jgi:hypothetical protein